MVTTDRVRASDLDRDRAIGKLGEHYAAGRLDLDEFTTRMGAAQTATYIDELTALFADLPQELHRPPVERRVALPRPAPFPLLRLAFPLAAVALIMLIAVVAVGHVLFPIWLPLIVLWSVALRRRGWNASGPHRRW